MSSRHRKYQPPHANAPKGLCRFCGLAVPKGRQRWCSKVCVEAFQLRAWPEMMRRFVVVRDRGICQLCGCQVAPAEYRYRRLLEIQDGFRDKPCWSLVPRCNQIVARTEEARRALRFDRPFDADHIVPLVEGGSFDPENVRLLCRDCHKQETASLARRRAVARKSPA